MCYSSFGIKAGVAEEETAKTQVRWKAMTAGDREETESETTEDR